MIAALSRLGGRSCPPRTVVVRHLAGVALVVTAGCGESAAPRQDPGPFSLLAVTDSAFAGEVGHPIPATPMVQLRYADGSPAAGVRVAFRPNDGSTLLGADTVSSRDGFAAAGTWILGAVSGAQTLTATAGSQSVTFRATATPGPLASLLAIESEVLLGEAGRPLSQALRVRVHDRYGNALVGYPVRFAVTAGGGSIDTVPSPTDARGIAASGPWTLGPNGGTQVATASAGGRSVAFAAAACVVSCRSASFAYVQDGHIVLAPFQPGSAPASIGFPDNLGFAPVWAPDGERLAFVRIEGKTPRGENQYGTWIKDLRGGPAVRLMAGRAASWSPDGRRLAVSRGNCVYECTSFIMDLADTTRKVQLPPLAAFPAWSPDGSRLAYVGLSGDDGYNTLHVINADGTQPREIVPSDGASFHAPSWSPDGTEFVVTRCSAGSCDALAVPVDAAAGERPRLLTSTGRIYSASWSPFGILLALLPSPDPTLAFVSPLGGTPIPLGLVGYGPVWRPATVR